MTRPREYHAHRRGPHMRAAIQDTPPGCCIACDLPLPSPGRSGGRRAMVHQDPDCRAYYMTVYGMDRRAREGRKVRP